MTDRALLQQALEALSRSDYLGWQLNIPIIKALRERLAQPEQEPVAWMHPDGRIWTFGRGFDKSTFTIPLYTTPPHRKPLTEKRIEELYSFWVVDCQDIVGFARAVERTVKGEA